MSRDNFTKTTIDILAKRVGYHCSNPDCRKLTVGPSEVEGKATLIGIAAHITAASPKGPRYENSIDEEERRHINNGIWLCSNCASLIDKDVKAFPIELLQEWKYSAEQEMRNMLLGKLETVGSRPQTPFIEADLIRSHAKRANVGYSPKNKDKFNGYIIPAGGKPIIFWDLTWNFSFVLHNNSQYPAYNVRIEQITPTSFTSLNMLPKVNNIPPYASIDLKASCSQPVEGEHTIADEIIKQPIPAILEGLEMAIIYSDEDRNEHKTIVKIINQEVVNEK